MHVVRVHPNEDEGVRFWAEDDRGFNGGADDLDELLAMIAEYVDADPHIGDWRAELVPAQRSSGDADLFTVNFNSPLTVPSRGAEIVTASNTRPLQVA